MEWRDMALAPRDKTVIVGKLAENAIAVLIYDIDNGNKDYPWCVYDGYVAYPEEGILGWVPFIRPTTTAKPRRWFEELMK